MTFRLRRNELSTYLLKRRSRLIEGRGGVSKRSFFSQISRSELFICSYFFLAITKKPKSGLGGRGYL